MGDYIYGGTGDDVIIAHAGDDLVHSGAGDDFVDAGPGNDRIYPGLGKDYVIAGPGDDSVTYSHVCELRKGAVVFGGNGDDTIVLPVAEQTARSMGLKYYGFEKVIYSAARASRFADCE
jgi:Ca2+-binding RTX toxin-like protein